MPYRSPSELAPSSESPPLPPARYWPPWRHRDAGIAVAGIGAMGLVTVVARSLSLFVPPWVVIGLIFAMLAMGAFLTRGRGIAARLDSALALLGAGRVSEAARALDAIIATSGGAPAVKVFAIASRASAFVRQGDFARASALITNLERSGWFIAKQHPQLPAIRAMAQALSGDLDRARATISNASTGGSTGVFLPVEIVIRIRDGHAKDAITKLDDEWLDAEAMLTGHDGRVLRVVRAFAVAVSGAEDGASVRAAIEHVGPFRPAEFDYLGVAWPEMAAFLSKHGLAQTDSRNESHVALSTTSSP